MREKVDLTMTSEILRMRFAHYLGDFANDEGYLQATYQAGLQVERLKTLEKVRELTRITKPDHEKKDGQNKKGSDSIREGRETDKRPPKIERSDQQKNPGPCGEERTIGTQKRKP